MARFILRRILACSRSGRVARGNSFRGQQVSWKMNDDHVPFERAFQRKGLATHLAKEGVTFCMLALDMGTKVRFGRVDRIAIRICASE